jgi:7,8-dihydropterin-6-yl-methyl-4-(beta-D-ribofuranosyl)aminobenzene 5'-phosphate synthase
MNTMNKFGEQKSVLVTALVDNMTDMLLNSTESVKRYTQESGPPLLAEHGLSLLVDLKDTGVKILMDAGITKITLMENIHRMKIDPKTINKIVLSHGHPDHIMAMTDIIKAIAGPPKARNWSKDATVDEIEDWMTSQRVPLICHSAAFRERWKVFPNGSKYGPMITPRAEWKAAGAEVIISDEPYKLADGCWTTGAVPRKTFEKAGTPKIFAFRDGGKFNRDFVDDDEAIIINIKEKGLVIVSGCAHAGILNTINHAKEISGINKVFAIIGGFHLISSTPEEIQKTIDEVKKLKPVIIVPTHCTGFPAIVQFAIQMPEEFVLGVVGTTYIF